jgi:hypothetical protein
LPVLGRPTKQANPDLNLAAAGVCGALTFVIVPRFGRSGEVTRRPRPASRR